jgi:hypothetical protein
MLGFLCSYDPFSICCIIINVCITGHVVHLFECLIIPKEYMQFHNLCIPPQPSTLCVSYFSTHAEFRRHKLKTAQNVQCKWVFDAEVSRKQVKGPFVMWPGLLFYLHRNESHLIADQRHLIKSIKEQLFSKRLTLFCWNVYA